MVDRLNVLIKRSSTLAPASAAVGDRFGFCSVETNLSRITGTVMNRLEDITRVGRDMIAT